MDIDMDKETYVRLKLELLEIFLGDHSHPVTIETEALIQSLMEDLGVKND